MSFAKAADLLRLADMTSARFDGVALADVAEEFQCDHRTAQRMMRAFEQVFPDVTVRDGPDRRRRWHLERVDQRWLQAQGLRDSDLAALEIAARRARRDGAPDEALRLDRLRERLLAAMPKSEARRTEADAEALLEAQGFACRPGPKAVTDLTLLGTLNEALRAPSVLSIMYQGARDDVPKTRRVEPHGLLLGTRQYLVARPVGGDGTMRRFRLDRISDAEITAQSFRRDAGFDLGSYAKLSFGSWHAPKEYGPVEWRFSPEAAETARQFIFHPDQQLTLEPDGSLIVRFEASGHLEMAWHLVQWGSHVQVIAPAALGTLMAQIKPGRFPAFP